MTVRYVRERQSHDVGAGVEVVDDGGPSVERGG